MLPPKADCLTSPASLLSPSICPSQLGICVLPAWTTSHRSSLCLGLTFWAVPTNVPAHCPACCRKRGSRAQDCPAPGAWHSRPSHDKTHQHHQPGLSAHLPGTHMWDTPAFHVQFPYPGTHGPDRLQPPSCPGPSPPPGSAGHRVGSLKEGKTASVYDGAGARGTRGLANILGWTEPVSLPMGSAPCPSLQHEVLYGAGAG